MRKQNQRHMAFAAASLLALSSAFMTGPALADGDDDGGFLCTYFGEYWPYAFLCDGGDGGTPPNGG